MIRIIPITGEGTDADIVSIPQYQEPSYPECPSCENESDAQGFCVDCDAFVTEHPPAVPYSRVAFDTCPETNRPRFAA